MKRKQTQHKCVNDRKARPTQQGSDPCIVFARPSIPSPASTVNRRLKNSFLQLGILQRTEILRILENSEMARVSECEARKERCWAEEKRAREMQLHTRYLRLNGAPSSSESLCTSSDSMRSRAGRSLSVGRRTCRYTSTWLAKAKNTTQM
ncbi:hypothetical protein DIPPA_34992 [Diplonema papillatum]|nr:hypothetical protein DIPPA_34992 [Diplonema papillatum]